MAMMPASVTKTLMSRDAPALSCCPDPAPPPSAEPVALPGVLDPGIDEPGVSVPPIDPGESGPVEPLHEHAPKVPLVRHTWIPLARSRHGQVTCWPGTHEMPTP